MAPKIVRASEICNRMTLSFWQTGGLANNLLMENEILSLTMKLNNAKRQRWLDRLVNFMTDPPQRFRMRVLAVL